MIEAVRTATRSIAPQTGLPSFKRPPISEVALALQFENLDAFDPRYIGSIAERFKERFPGFLVQPPLDPIIERVDQMRRSGKLSLQMADASVVPRLWFIDASDVELVQLQRDRLMHNWRRRSDSDEYPRYTRLRAAFVEDWRTLERWTADEQLGTLKPTQAEVAYINHIEAGEPGGPYADPSEVFSFIAPALVTHGLASFEAITHSTSLIARAKETDSLVGRLYVELSSGVNSRTNKLVYQLTLTLRGAPPSRDLDGALVFFDFARERIVKLFAELTTGRMHEIWGRET